MPIFVINNILISTVVKAVEDSHSYLHLTHYCLVDDLNGDITMHVVPSYSSEARASEFL